MATESDSPPCCVSQKKWKFNLCMRIMIPLLHEDERSIVKKCAWVNRMSLRVRMNEEQSPVEECPCSHGENGVMSVVVFLPVRGSTC